MVKLSCVLPQAGREPGGLWAWLLPMKSWKPTCSQSAEAETPSPAADFSQGSGKTHRACCNRKVFGQSTSLKKTAPSCQSAKETVVYQPFLFSIIFTVFISKMSVDPGFGI